MLGNLLHARPVTDPAALEVARVRRSIAAHAPADSDRGLIDQLDELERLKAAVAATQARITDHLDRRRAAAREARELLGDEEPRRPHPDAGLGREIGLARRESPHEGRRFLGLARALLHDLPHTLAALTCGDLNERRARIIADETSDLTREQRAEVDAALAAGLAGPGGGFDGLGDADLRDAVRREVLRRDEEGFLDRQTRARSRRRVTGRILGDGVARLTAVIPTEQYSTIIRSLDDAAASAVQQGDERTRGQLVTDIFVERLGGPQTDAPAPAAIKLLVSAETLLGDDSEPGYVIGAGYVPASVARSIAAQGVEHLRSTLQRVFFDPATGRLITMESASALFRGELAEFLTLRDRRCRTPYCSAPIRQRDHVRPRARGGRTDRDNGQGLCEACNYAKEARGWAAEPVPDSLAVTEIDVTTPTGHRHRSRAPDPPIAS